MEQDTRSANERHFNRRYVVKAVENFIMSELKLSEKAFREFEEVMFPSTDFRVAFPESAGSFVIDGKRIAMDVVYVARLSENVIASGDGFFYERHNGIWERIECLIQPATFQLLFKTVVKRTLGCINQTQYQHPDNYFDVVYSIHAASGDALQKFYPLRWFSDNQCLIVNQHYDSGHNPYHRGFKLDDMSRAEWQAFIERLMKHGAKDWEVIEMRGEPSIVELELVAIADGFEFDVLIMPVLPDGYAMRGVEGTTWQWQTIYTGIKRAFGIIPPLPEDDALPYFGGAISFGMIAPVGWLTGYDGQGADEDDDERTGEDVSIIDADEYEDVFDDNPLGIYVGVITEGQKAIVESFIFDDKGIQDVNNAFERIYGEKSPFELHSERELLEEAATSGDYPDRPSLESLGVDDDEDNQMYFHEQLFDDVLPTGVTRDDKTPTPDFIVNRNPNEAMLMPALENIPDEEPLTIIDQVRENKWAQSMGQPIPFPEVEGIYDDEMEGESSPDEYSEYERLYEATHETLADSYDDPRDDGDDFYDDDEVPVEEQLTKSDISYSRWSGEVNVAVTCANRHCDEQADLVIPVDSGEGDVDLQSLVQDGMERHMEQEGWGESSLNGFDDVWFCPTCYKLLPPEARDE